MLQAIRNMVSDIRIINALSLEAERQARLAGLANPGAEHYLLAALALEEGSARRALAALGANPAGVRAAIAAQHHRALAKVGIAGLDDPEEALQAPPPRLFDAAASGKALVQSLPKLRRAHASAALCGAHVLLAVAAMPNSTAARSLVQMGIEPAALAKAAEQVLQGA
jgi:ATP-dependent Clp protease ATP-binding subunit ClpA